MSFVKAVNYLRFHEIFCLRETKNATIIIPSIFISFYTILSNTLNIFRIKEMNELGHKL